MTSPLPVFAIVFGAGLLGAAVMACPPPGATAAARQLKAAVGFVGVVFIALGVIAYVLGSAL